MRSSIGDEPSRDDYISDDYTCDDYVSDDYISDDSISDESVRDDYISDHITILVMPTSDPSATSRCVMTLSVMTM